MADRVFAYIQPDGSWYINNTGFVVGSSSVVSIDACSTERRTRDYLACIASVTPAPVTTLINTHHHGDHTYGNAVLGAATIVGHERCRVEVLENGPPANRGIWSDVEWGDITLAPPNLTFADRIRLWSDDRPIDVRYVGKSAHTTNDSLVWLPEQEVLFCGDLLFNGGTPFLLSGSVIGAIDVLTNVLAPIPARTVVPGHGAPCDAALIPTAIGYLEFVLATAKAGREAGLTPLQAARETQLGDYAGWLDSERIVGNLHRAYADLDPQGRPVDVSAALRDMIEFNGSRPLSCHA
ncbi:MBL fold metallo-hydrolase [Streptomyces sp. NBC_00878]|uniref:MBL fold metallo-hydrolase n=1 Tax=Streptomyces sp. NBC_00878 TaxID=2975854 RepID=UPI00225A2D3E|nr:MBL fold metallo-hydrolase [Streptomyces sp. NBC_00878]MCX4903835.1 MBL fold metallo-hydrolase [Streptomyces sp. NBC_00878]